MGIGPMVIFFCFLLSGVSSLIYEVVWMRQLILIFGSTTFAISTVLTAFMGGLALGSFLFGRFIDRSRHPVGIYGILESAIGLYALLVPIIFQGLIPLYQWVWQNFHLNFYLFSLLQFTLVFLVLLVPTTLMGATLPILGKYFSSREDQLGWTVGSLYALNTLGGILGTFLSGFFFLPLLGVRKTTFLAAGLNLFIGLVVILLSQTTELGEKVSPKGKMTSWEPGGGEPLSSRMLGLILAAFGLSGFASMIYEVTWSRILALILDSSTYAFTIMLTTFLVGIALGSFLMSKAIDRLRHPLGVFILIEGAIGVTAFMGLFLFGELPYLFVVLYRSFAGSLPVVFVAKFVLAFLVMFLPTLLIGALFPLVVKLYTPNLQRVGRSISEVYSFNTVGCILGSFAGGFILVPWLGIQRSILLASGLNIFLAWILLFASPYRWKWVKAPLAAFMILGTGTMAIYAPPWNPNLMSSGVYMYVRFVLDLDRRQLLDRYTKEADPLLFYREGYSATVSVHRSRTSENIYLKVNGKVEASTIGDMPTQVLLAQVPMLLSRNPEDVLVIGFGSGVTVGSVGTHPAKHITVVELEPAVVEASRYFAEVNNDIQKDPRVKMILQDARNHLLVTPEKFDVIISEPSNPWMAGVANLFTREFFMMGSQRMKPGGIFCQWLQLYKIDSDNLRSILKTFQETFPYLLVFESSEYDLLILGSLEPIRIDLSRLESRLARPSVQKDLQRIQIQSVRDVLTHFIFGDREVPAFVQKAPINTDDNALLEFSAPRTLYLDTSEENFKELSKYAKGLAAYLER